MALLTSFLHFRTTSTPLAGPEKDSMTMDPLTSSFSHLRMLPSKENEREEYYESTLEYGPELNVENEGDESDTTLEDVDLFGKIGHPLERIPRLGEYQEGLGLIRRDSDDEPEFGHGVVYHPGTACSSCCSSRSQSPFSVTSSLTGYQTIVEDLLSVPDNPFDLLDPQNFVTYDPIPASTLFLSTSGPPLMIKRIARDSFELSLIKSLNSSELRQDPWNPCPHVLQVVDHDPQSDHVYLCMERLNEYDVPPMSTMAQYIDFFRQALESLSFLHEHGFVGLACSDPSAYMVDLSSGPYPYSYTINAYTSSTAENGHGNLPNHGPHTPLNTNYHSHHQSPHGSRFDHQHQPQQPQTQQTPLANATVQVFDRSTYPVRYYFVNFTNTQRFREDGSPYQPRDRTSQASASTSTSSSHSSPSSSPNISHPPSPVPSRTSSCSKHPVAFNLTCAYKQDVQELGSMFNTMLNDLPDVVAIKFKALIKAMTFGGFGAEDARKLFEALCKSLEARVFELEVKSGVGIRSRSVEPEVDGGFS